MDPVLGRPDFLSVRNGFLTGPQGQDRGVSSTAATAFLPEDPHRAIRAFLEEHRALLSHGPEVLETAVLRRDYVTAHNGLRTVCWEQQLDGIPVYGSILMGHLTKRGELVNLTTRIVPSLAQAADRGAQNRAAIQAEPPVSVEHALRLAAGNVGLIVPLDEIRPAEGTLADGWRTFTAAPALKGAAYGRRVWFPVSGEALRLGWEIIFVSGSRGEGFLMVVDAETGLVQLRRHLTRHLRDVTYRVYASDSPSPLSPGWPTPNSAQPPAVPRTLLTFAALDTHASPNGWINDFDSETRGNNVDAHTDQDDNDAPDLPRPQGGVRRVFDFPIDLAQDPGTYSAAAVVNLFYWANWAHDRLYRLGFTEAAGNCQTENFGRGGLAGDAMLADAQDGGGVNNANCLCTPDGIPPRLQMYLFDGPTPMRDGSLDAEIILHEYLHAVTERLLGGGVGVTYEGQSGAIHEGNSDFYALALLSEAGDDPGGSYAQGAYVFNDYCNPQGPCLEANYYFGIRRYPYSTNLARNPLTLKDIDAGQARRHPDVPVNPIWDGYARVEDVHMTGEVWCSVLWEVRANLIAQHGAADGNELALQLVTDGMRLCPPDPNFLQFRDAMAQADLINHGGANYLALWTAFAKRGMGGSATAPSGPNTRGVVEAFDLPGLAYVSLEVEDASAGNNNGVVDPNECVDLYLTVRNGTLVTASNITASLATTNWGIVVAEATARFPDLGPAATARSLTPFRVSTPRSLRTGEPIPMTLTLSSSEPTRTNAFGLDTGRLSPTPVSVHNDSPCPILESLSPDDVTWTTQKVVVAGFANPIGRVTVSLHATHPRPGDLTIDLESPGGQRLSLIQNRGSWGFGFGTNCEPESARTTLDDRAALAIDTGHAPFVGEFRPEQPLAMLAGAQGSAANGEWRLCIADTKPFFAGTLECWTLNLFPIESTDGGGHCLADVALSAWETPDPVVIGSNLTYTITVENRRSESATDVTITNLQPPGVRTVALAPSRGDCTTSGGAILWSLGELAPRASATLTMVVQPHLDGLFTNSFTVGTSAVDADPANNTILLRTAVVPATPQIVSAGAALAWESRWQNGAIEPGEKVTVNLALRNAGATPADHVTATLLPQGGLVPEPTNATAHFGTLPACGPVVVRPFTFTAGTDVSSVTAALEVHREGTDSPATNLFVLPLSCLSSCTNTSPIWIPDSGSATPYPSEIWVSGSTHVPDEVSVTLHGLTHGAPQDLDLILEDPNWRHALFMSDAGASFPVANLDVVIEDAAANPLPALTPLATGSYRPHDYPPEETLPDVSLPYATGSLSVFRNQDPQGGWSLYVYDDMPGAGGQISGGWSLTFVNAMPLAGVADMEVTVAVWPAQPRIGDDLTCTIRVVNHGPSTHAADVVLTDSLPAGVEGISATASQGTVLAANDTVRFFLGTIPTNIAAVATLIVRPASAGPFLHQVAVTAREDDPNPANNEASAALEVQPPGTLGDLAIALAGDRVRLSWPAAATQCLLESASSLNLLDWSPVTTPASLEGERMGVLETLGPSPRFYRLRCEP